MVFSFDRAVAEGSLNAQKGLFEGINEVTAIDDVTVEIGLDAPKGSLLANLAWGDAVIVSPATADGNAQKPVGTGPFAFSNWVQGDRIELVRRDDYWGEAPALEKITFKFISDPTAAFAAMMAGDIDAFPIFPAPENLPQFEADPRFQVLVGSTEGETILAMNNGQPAVRRHPRPPGDQPRHRPQGGHRRRDVRLRHPDRQPLRAAPPGLRRPDRLRRPTTRRRRRRCSPRPASPGCTPTLMLPPPSYARRGGEIVAAQLRAVGIEPQIVNVEWAQWLEQVFKNKDYDLTIVSHTEPMDIEIYARPDYYFDAPDPADARALGRGPRHRRPRRAGRAPQGRAGAGGGERTSTSSCSSSPRPASPTPASAASG